ncbi:hypothetical protein D6C95_03423 [Aureobasidium pullulans]|nr:hypothetical protein D6C95_03423 [Aureobasidium pullulans]
MFELVTGWKTWPLATFAMLLAVFLNCIQIPSLITPGSLSTEIVSKRETLLMDVPTTRICQFGFKARGHNTADVNETGCYAYYDIVSDRINSGLNKVLWGTSYAGQIPQLKSPCGVNASPDFAGLASGYLPQNYSESYASFFMAFGGSTMSLAGKNFTVYQRFNMTLLTGTTPVTYKSWDCGLFNTSMALEFSYTGQSSSQVVFQQPLNYLNQIDLQDSSYDDYSDSSSLMTYWTQMTGLFTGIVHGQAISHDKYDASGVNSQPGTFSQRTANLSAARDTSLGRYIYTGPDRLTAGYDPSAPGDAGTALEEISRNISVAMTQIMEYQERTPVTFTKDVLVFKYTWKTLALPYAAGVSVTLIIIFFGVVALLSDGIVSDFRFSTILRTTRNDAPEFDRLFRGSRLGANPLPEVIETTRLRFGCMVSNSTGEMGTAFVLDGPVKS